MPVFSRKSDTEHSSRQQIYSGAHFEKSPLLALGIVPGNRVSALDKGATLVCELPHILIEQGRYK